MTTRPAGASPARATPTATTPAPRPRSLRRVTSITASRPDGLNGSLVLTGRADDHSDGRAHAHAELDARIDFQEDRLISVQTWPPRGLETLAGQSPRAGFRRAATGTLADVDPIGSALRQLVDDVPVVVLVSGSVIAEQQQDRALVDRRLLTFVDVCEGGRAGSTMMTRSPDGTRVKETRPRVAGDVLVGVPGWRELAPLRPTETRRLRRTDVWVDGDLHFEGFFRDSLVPAVGVNRGHECVIHEYSISGRVARDGHALLEIVPVSRVLPWPECPAALASARRAVGRRVDDFRRTLGGELSGVGTCTHLTDLLRTVSDVPYLASHLGA